MKELLDYLQQFDTLNEQQAEMVTSKAKLVKLPKETYFSEAGKVPKQVGFILEGVLRFCYYNNKGQEVTHYFVGEGQFITDFPRFEAQIISAEYIQTVTDCKLLVFTKEDWDYLLATIVTWRNIETKMIKKCLNESISRRSPMGRSANLASSVPMLRVPDLRWKIAGIGDFDGDGRADLFWRHANGSNAVWRSANHATTLSVLAVAPAWHIATVGDYDGDGRADLFWRNTSTGQNVVWRAASYGGGLPTTAVGAGWSVVPAENRQP